MKLRLSVILYVVAGLFVLSGILILILTFFPLAREEIRYATGVPKTTTPVDSDFGIVIPKIGANARIIANVDPFDARAYQFALTKGVAQASGTSVPGASGNIFLFAHSSENFYEAMRYNSVFYLLDKLDKNDEIDVYYNKVKFVYRVTGKKFADPKEISYITGDRSGQTLTLMTCWPPGTNISRLLVIASLSAL